MFTRTPKYRLHKPTLQAVVTLGGKDIYLGRYGSIESKSEYDRLIAEWLANGRQHTPASDATISELMVGYIHHVDAYYVKDGVPTSEAGLIKLSLRVLKNLYGHTLARDFGPLALKAVRLGYIDAGLCRTEVNRRTAHVVRFVKWCVANELVPASVHHGLQAVEGLRKGRCNVRENKPIKPVPDAYVDAIEPYVSRQVWTMIQLQRLTGARPGEICIMRTMDLDMTGRVWEYIPERHKTEHHGRERRVYLGPKAQEIVRPWLRVDLQACLFSPREAEAERLAEMRRRRKMPVQPSQVDRRKPGRDRNLGDRYDVRAYLHAIYRGCHKAGVPTWGPNRLRHSAATYLRKEFGLDVARVILGHSSPAVTQIYAEVDREKAIRVMAEVG
jgi:integrase